MTIRILLTYHSEEGQTAKVAARIATVLRSKGATVDVTECGNDPSPLGYDGAIVGGSIHVGRHGRPLRHWLTRHVDDLDDIPTAVFQVSLTSARDDPEHSAEAHQMLNRLLEATGLDPDLVGLFAGALAYTRYGWLKRTMMRRIASTDGGDTDTSRDYEYTDWDAVEHFASDALAVMESRASARST